MQPIPVLQARPKMRPLLVMFGVFAIESAFHLVVIFHAMPFGGTHPR